MKQGFSEFLVNSGWKEEDGKEKGGMKERALTGFTCFPPEKVVEFTEKALSISFLFYFILFMRERERKAGAEGERGSPQSTEPNAGLNPRMLGSPPKPKLTEPPGHPQYVRFYMWLFLFSIMCLRFIHVVYIKSLLLITTEKYSIISLFINPLTY